MLKLGEGPELLVVESRRGTEGLNIIAESCDQPARS